MIFGNGIGGRTTSRWVFLYANSAEGQILYWLRCPTAILIKREYPIKITMAHVEEGNKDGNPDPTIHYEMTEGDKIDANAGSQVPVLPKSFNLLSACTTGITTGNTWALLGGSIV